MLKSKPARSEKLKSNKLTNLLFWQATKQKKHSPFVPNQSHPRHTKSLGPSLLLPVCLSLFLSPPYFLASNSICPHLESCFQSFLFFCIWWNAPSILPFISAVLQGLPHTSQNVLPKFRQCSLSLVLLLCSHPHSSLPEPTFQSFPRLPSLPICRSCHVQSKHSRQGELAWGQRTRALVTQNSC